MTQVSDIIRSVAPISTNITHAIQTHLDDLTKPPGALGRLEELAMQYCLVKGNPLAKLEKMAVFTFAGDHGITEEKITPYPSEVTPQMVMNMVAGGAAASVMCRTAGIDYKVVDMGVKTDFPEMDGLIQIKVAKGTKNFAREPAMSTEECEKAIINGYSLIRQCTADIIGIGEMGIGNSSSAAALYSLYLDLPAKTTAGAGTGSVGELYARKVDAIQQGLDLHKSESAGNPLEVLCRVGGFEICGMVGAIFGAVSKRIPVVVDGFIAGAAACAASRIAPASKGYIIYSHKSAEKFHREYLETEKAKPVLDLDMRLGEGTGAILALQIIQQAMACYNRMATFSSAGVSGKDTDDD